MIEHAKKIIISRFIVTELADNDDIGAVKVSVPHTEASPGVEYFTIDKSGRGSSNRHDGMYDYEPYRFKLFPVVLDSEGVPWAEANEWIMASIEGKVVPNMASYYSIADDLASYCQFIKEAKLDWTEFPINKLHRPTYRYNAYLLNRMMSEEISISTAKRRMATVIRFYRWLIEEKVFNPTNAPWKESDRCIDYKDPYGFIQKKIVVTTDVSIKAPMQDDPYDNYIVDGGKLHPLSQDEQDWLIEALFSLGNTEMALIHLFGLLTGARIQTILTFRVRHALRNMNEVINNEVRIPIGYGTGIDTKYGKKQVLHIPVLFYNALQIYALSKRSRVRRIRAVGGDTENQYLFLSIRGAPMYESIEDKVNINLITDLRHTKTGQGVRQFIKERVIPLIRGKYKEARNFKYRFHDTRATYGMNLLNDQMKLVDEKKITLNTALNFVKVRMGHSSLSTTEKYLKHRSGLKMVRLIQDGWELHLKNLVERFMGDLNE